MTIGFSPLRNYLLLLLPLALSCNAPAQEFRVPEIGKLPRVDRCSPRPSPYHQRNSAFILTFKDHVPQGEGYVILSGSCFSAVPVKSDFPHMTSAPGGYKVSQRPAFATRYVERGATVFFGYMRLSFGFPHLYPVLEKWLGATTVRETYQQLISGLIDMRGFGPLAKPKQK